jgi:hypothetical protein
MRNSPGWADLTHTYWEALGGHPDAISEIAAKCSGPHGDGTLRALDAILGGAVLPESRLTATLVKSAKPKRGKKAEKRLRERLAAALKSARAQGEAAYSEQDHWRAP